MSDLKEKRFQKLAELIRNYNVRTVLEIGTFQGESAIFFAKQPKVQWVTCIDPFVATGDWAKELAARGVANPYYDECVRNLQTAGVDDKVRLVRKKSEEAVETTGEYHLVYIDGDHSYEQCKLDIELYRPKAKKILCGDDHHCDESGKPYFPGVVQVVKELCPNAEIDGLLWWEVI